MKKVLVFLLVGVMAVSVGGCGNIEREKEIGNSYTDTENELVADISDDSEEDEDKAYEDKEDEDKVYEAEAYGTIEATRQEFAGETNQEPYFYYEMEKFFLSDSFPNGDLINDTLQRVYDEYESIYAEDAESYGDSLDHVGVPYDSLHLLHLTLVGDDYISILYNDIAYMGGAHPYSCFDAITIDCKTGKEVSASELLGKGDEDILTQVSDRMGMDVVASWEELDFYLTDSKVVFFYRMPGYWEDVVWERQGLSAAH